MRYEPEPGDRECTTHEVMVHVRATAVFGACNRHRISLAAMNEAEKTYVRTGHGNVFVAVFIYESWKCIVTVRCANDGDAQALTSNIYPRSVSRWVACSER